MDKYAKTGVAILYMDSENKILLGHRTKDDAWGLVGGKIDWCETFEEAAKRESMEEVGLEPTKLTNLGMNNAIDESKNEQHFTVFYHASDYVGEVIHKEPDKHYEWSWFHIDELPSNLFLPFRYFLPKLKHYIENGI